MSSNDITATPVYKDYTLHQLEATAARLTEKSNGLRASISAIETHVAAVSERYDTLLLQRPLRVREVQRVMVEWRDSLVEKKRIRLELMSNNRKLIDVLMEQQKRVIEREKEQELEKALEREKGS